FQVILASDGKRGIELALKELPDVILCDVMMPELDGHAVLTQVRSHPPTATTPFLFLSARGEKTDLRTGMNLGAADYLTKPCTREDLLEAIAVRLTRRRMHDAQIAAARSEAGFKPNFESSKPLESLKLTPREAEVLLWVAQGKSNGDIAILLGMAEKTVKKHMSSIFEKLGVEGRNAATIRALEVLSSAPQRESSP